MLARDLGFMNAPALKGWAEAASPYLGQPPRRAHVRRATGRSPSASRRLHRVMVSEIVARWAAASRTWLDAAIPVHADRRAALTALQSHDPEGAADHRGRALHRRLPARPPAPPGEPAVASALIAFVGGAARTVIPRRTAPAPRPCPRRRQEGGAGPGAGRRGRAGGSPFPTPASVFSTHLRGRFA